MTDATTPQSGLEKYGIEWWYMAHLAYGAIQLVFIPILVPTFVLEVTKSATLAGATMAVIGLGGLLAPVIGGMADKYRAHRFAQLGGLASYALGGLLFAFMGQTMFGILGGALCMGIGSATLLMINPAFVVSAGFAPDDEAIRLTRLNQIMIFGSLIAGLGLSALTSMGLPYAGRFITLSLLAVGALVVTFLTNSEAAARIKVADPAENGTSDRGADIKTLLMSPFGMLLLAVFFVTTGHGVITGQFPNYMQDVFAVDPGTSALALSVSAVVSLLILDAVGRWMGKSGPSPVWIAAVAMKVLMILGLGFLSISSGNYGVLIPLGLYVIYLQGISWADMVQPALAARASAAGAGMTQGLLMFAIASAYAAGNFIGGAAADVAGFASLAWIVALVSVIALLIGFKAFRKSQPAESTEHH